MQVEEQAIIPKHQFRFTYNYYEVVELNRHFIDKYQDHTSVIYVYT